LANPLIEHLPAPVQAAVRLALGRLSPEQRRDLERWLPGMGGNITGVKDVLRFITDNYRAALDRGGTTIAIVGPANVGKSTLYNQLITSSEARAAVSPVPGTTRANQAGSGGIFTVIDTPGADAVGPVGDRERDLAFLAAQGADFLIILFDAGSGVSRGDRELFDALVALDKPYVAVLNKMDLVRKSDRVRVIESAAANLGIDASQLIDIVATKGDHVGHVVLAVAQADPRLLIALADALPAYRAKLAWQRIIGAATASASVALIPLPMADVLPLLGVQTGLVLTIARIYGYDITPARARELIATFGVAFAARAVQRQLSKLLGAPGWVLSAAVATSATVGMGYAAMMWFERGEKPTQAALQKIMQEVGQYLRDQLSREGKAKPSLRTLRARVRAALEGLPERFRP
jgi:GTP-binding protein Era